MTRPGSIRRTLQRLALLLGLALAAGTLAQSDTAAGASAWRNLSPAQRSVLAPLERNWGSISNGQQRKWAELANRFPALPPDERARVQLRMAEWSRMSPQERARARLNFQEARQLSPQERQQQWDAYRALPADQRRELADRARPAPARSGNAAGSVEPSVKSSVVRVPPATQTRPVGPTVVQPGAGATTKLVSKPATPPLHQQAGLPKVAATPGFVDAATLQPKRGAQGAAVRSVAAGASQPARQ